MEYLKYKPDYLFDGTRLFNDGRVLITDTNGKVKDVICLEEAGEGVETLHGILSPGFINAHCHLELSHLKNIIPRKTGLVNFVFSVISERHHPEAEILQAIEESVAGMRSEGIVAVGDICNNSLSLYEKAKKNIQSYSFIEVSGWHPDVAQQRFEKSKSYYEEFVKKKMNVSMVPHAPYSVSGNLWGKITPFFKDKVITIHNQETKDEDLFFLKGTGDFVKMYDMMKIDNSFYVPKKVRSLETYFTRLSAAASVILVHNTFTKQEDVEYVNLHTPPGQRVSFCLCANANLYIENKLPPVTLLVKNNCNIIVGTDSLASNQQLSILEELKTLAENFPGIATGQLLQWATINGAKSLQMDDILGSFEKGKKPGAVLLSNTIATKLTRDTIARKIF